MKEDELREHVKCSKCKKKVIHTGLPIFWTLKIDRHGIKIDAIKRQDGLTAMLNGNAVLARAMGVNEEMTQPLMDTLDITLCETCAMPIMEIMEYCKIN